MSSYEEVVTAATVGLAQRPLEIRSLAGPAAGHAGVLGDEPATALLEAAALLDAARRAGGLSPSAVTPPSAAPADESPELSPLAGEIMRAVLAAGDRELLADLLRAAAARGARVAPPDLPVLLAVAGQHRALRAAAVPVLGQRGRWLAALNPEWGRVIDTAAAHVPVGAWETGHLAERVAWLRELRERDPAAGRETLAAGWRRETGDDRVALLAALAAGLGPADEAFLEAALDDRKAEVREQSRRLLARLPSSAFVERATRRARGVLQVEGRRRRRRLRIAHPPPFDSAARRDGLAGPPPQRTVGDAAWRLFQVVASAPLSLWTADSGLSPGELVGLDIADDFGDEFGGEVHAAWRAAAVRERNAEWARTLLTAPCRNALAPPDVRLVELLPVPERVARAIAVLEGDRPGTIADVGACPAPWSAPLTDAVLGYLGGQARSSAPPPPGDLPRLLARRADVADPRDLPGWLRELAGRFRARTAGVPPAGRWPAPLERAADLLDLRRQFARELP